MILYCVRVFLLEAIAQHSTVGCALTKCQVLDKTAKTKPGQSEINRPKLAGTDDLLHLGHL